MNCNWLKIRGQRCVVSIRFATKIYCHDDDDDVSQRRMEDHFLNHVSRKEEKVFRFPRDSFKMD